MISKYFTSTPHAINPEVSASLSISPESLVSLPIIAFFALIWDAADNPILHASSGVKNLLTIPRTPELPKSSPMNSCTLYLTGLLQLIKYGA